MSPAAAATPGTWRTRSIVLASIVGCWRFSLSLTEANGLGALTTAAVPS
jgi:hypothetical protein